MSKFEGAIKPSSIEQEAYEANVAATRVMSIESNQQMRCEYNADRTTLYRGFAPKGLEASQDGWLIQKFTYDANKQVTLRQIAYDSWDDRATTASYS